MKQTGRCERTEWIRRNRREPSAYCPLFTAHCSATCCSLLAACCPLPSAHCPQTACTSEFALRSTAIQRICFRFVSPAKPPTTQAARAHVRIFCAARNISPTSPYATSHLPPLPVSTFHFPSPPTTFEDRPNPSSLIIFPSSTKTVHHHHPLSRGLSEPLC